MRYTGLECNNKADFFTPFKKKLYLFIYLEGHHTCASRGQTAFFWRLTFCSGWISDFFSFVDKGTLQCPSKRLSSHCPQHASSISTSIMLSRSRKWDREKIYQAIKVHLRSRPHLPWGTVTGWHRPVSEENLAVWSFTLRSFDDLKRLPALRGTAHEAVLLLSLGESVLA